MERQYAALKDILEQIGPCLVAFSGGVDSTFLLRVAHDVLGDDAVAVTAVSPSLPASEREEAAALARLIGSPHVVISTAEIDDPDYVRNDERRCYFCKLELFRAMRRVSPPHPERALLYGAVVDDLGDDRPGMTAAREAGARAPLIEAGLTKEMIRALSRRLGLPTWDKPAMACLASRIPRFTPVTVESLARVERAEAAVKRLGYRQVRVRCQGNGARIELDSTGMDRLARQGEQLALIDTVRRAGFESVVIDPRGYRPGGHAGPLPEPACAAAGREGSSGEAAGNEGGTEAYQEVAPPAQPEKRQVNARDLLSSFMEIAAVTAAAEDIDLLLERIARILGRLFPVDGAALALREEGAVVVREIVRKGEVVRRDPARLPDDPSHMFGWVIAHDRPLWRNDIGTELRFRESLPDGGMRSDMVIPLRAHGRVMGTFRVSCERRHAFDPEDFEIFRRCADLTAVAVENQRLLTATRRLAEIDGLTGISNHRHFLALLGQEVERCRRTGRPLSLILIDIDDFKGFNDTHGHQVGDAVLRHVAQIVAGLLRRSDVVARYGGEEFVAVLPEAGFEAALGVAEKLRAGVERSSLTIPGSAILLHVRVSLGVATMPGDAATGGELVEAADRGLYRAKRGGKNRVCHHGGAEVVEGK